MTPRAYDARVAEITATFGSESAPVRRRGSGFLLPGGVVLPAWHVGAGARSVRCVFDAGLDSPWESETAGSPLRVGAGDVALVRLRDDSHGTTSVPIGTLGADPEVVAETLGFPWWKLRKSHPPGPQGGVAHARYHRDLAQVAARLAPLANRRNG